MYFLDMIKRIFGITKDSKEWSLKDVQQILSLCDEKITELNEKLKENSSLQKSLDAKIYDLHKRVSSLEKEFKEQAETLKNANDDLRNSNLHLQEENESLIGRSSNNVYKLINFCELQKTMEISSVEECISIIRNEIMQSTTEMGFDIIDSYEGEFNHEIHTIVDTQFTNDVNQNNQIAKVVRPGVWYDNKCLIPQDVVVYTVNR